MAEGDQRFAYAVFRDAARTEQAVAKLISAGFATEHIGALMVDSGRVREKRLRHKTGITWGVVLGAPLGALVGVAALDGVFAVSWTALMGAGAGALAGTLAGLGVWKDDLHLPREVFERGGVALGVVTTASGRASQAVEVLRAAGGENPRTSSHAEAKAHLRELGHHARVP